MLEKQQHVGKIAGNAARVKGIRIRRWGAGVRMREGVVRRGAASAVFVEADPACCEAIARSLARTNLGDRGVVIRGRLPAALGALEGTFDIISADPPYGAAETDETIVEAAKLLAPGGLIVLEHASRYNPPGRPAGTPAAYGPRRVHR